jgi:hypothetical protein
MFNERFKVSAQTCAHAAAGSHEWSGDHSECKDANAGHAPELSEQHSVAPPHPTLVKEQREDLSPGVCTELQARPFHRSI